MPKPRWLAWILGEATTPRVPQAQPGVPYQRPAGPFADRVRKRTWPMTVDEALAAAEAAGYLPTGHSKPTKLHVQRNWNNAAAITPVPSGMLIRPAWTTAQIVLVVVVLLALCGGACGPLGLIPFT